MNRNEKKFKKLERLWYDKLSKEGFKDIEDTRHEERLLKQWDMNFFRNNFDEIRYQATLTYYQQARRLLRTYAFKNQAQKKIWELHSEGITERQIARRIRTYKKSMVHYVIAEISKQIKRE